MFLETDNSIFNRGLFRLTFIQATMHRVHYCTITTLHDMEMRYDRDCEGLGDRSDRKKANVTYLTDIQREHRPLLPVQHQAVWDRLCLEKLCYIES